MASQFAKHAVLCTSRAVASRTALSARSFAPATRLWSASPIRSFSQTVQRLEKRYTEGHEWVDVSPDGKTCKVGITKYAAEALGDVVYVEVAEVGDEVDAEEPFGSVESVKSASDISSPISGTVLAVNDPIVETPADIGNDPEGEGWLIELETADASAADSLMDAEAYAEFTANQ